MSTGFFRDDLGVCQRRASSVAFFTCQAAKLLQLQKQSFALEFGREAVQRRTIAAGDRVIRYSKFLHPIAGSFTDAVRKAAGAVRVAIQSIAHPDAANCCFLKQEDRPGTTPRVVSSSTSRTMTYSGGQQSIYCNLLHAFRFCFWSTKHGE